MRVVRQDNSPTNITLTVSGEAADLAPIHRHVLGHFASSVKVPGFRAGKAPGYVIEKNINQQALVDEFMEHALNELYRRAVDQEKIRPVSTPNVQLKKFVPFTDLEFEAETEIIGPIKLPNYKSIRQAKPKVEVTLKEVNEVIKSLQNRLAERTEVNRPAKAGDELIIDFAGSDQDGKPVAGADGKDYPLVLGSKTFIPGFEENLAGVKKGDIKEFDVTFPKDYGVAAMRGQKVSFKVDVKQVQELKVPKVDDNFAQKAGPVKTVGELKADIKKELTAEKQRQADIDYQNQLIKKIVDKATVDAPTALVEEEIGRMEEEEKRNLTYRGQTWQEHLKAEAISEEQHRERQRPDAIERVKAGLILSEIAEQENISATPEELEIRLQILKGQYQDPAMQAELDKPENQRDVQARLLTEKTIQRLVDYANSK